MDLIVQIAAAELLSHNLQIENVVPERKLALHDDQAAMRWAGCKAQILRDHDSAFAGSVLQLLLIRDAVTGPTGFIRGNRVDAAIAECGSDSGAVVDILVEIIAKATHRV